MATARRLQPLFDPARETLDRPGLAEHPLKRLAGLFAEVLPSNAFDTER